MKLNRIIRPLMAVVLVVAVSGYVCAKRAKFPRPRGYVGDFAGVIPSNHKQNIEKLAMELERKTSVEIAVVTVNDLNGMDLEGYAADLFEEWGIGKKGKDNGLLLLLAMKERKAKIEVGYGLEGIIPDGLAGDIIRQKMLPAFREGRFGLGLFNAAAVSAGLIAKDSGVELSFLNGIPEEYYRMSGKKTAKNTVLGKLLYLLFLFLVFGGRMIFFPMLLGGGFWSGGGGGFGGGGGGFGGFGGGMSGGGGASGSW